MELLWLALLMTGCALMMVVMMRMMDKGSDGRAEPTDGPAPDEDRRAALETEAAELRARLADRDEGSP